MPSEPFSRTTAQDVPSVVYAKDGIAGDCVKGSEGCFALTNSTGLVHGRACMCPYY